MSQCDAAVLWIRADGAWPAGAAGFAGCIRSSGWPGAGVAPGAESAAAEAQRQAKRARAETLERILRWHLKAAGLDDGLEEQVRFDPVRRWRFDFAWPAERLAVEVDGGLWIRGRHSRPIGQRADMEKRNEAVLAGWRVLRVTREHLRSGEALAWVARARGREFRKVASVAGATLPAWRELRTARAGTRAARALRPTAGAPSTAPSGTGEPTASDPAPRRAGTGRRIGAGARRS